MHIKRGTVRERRPVVARFAIKNPRRNTIAAIKDLLLVSKKVVIEKKRHKSNSLKACICHLHFGSLYRHRVYSCLTILCLNIPFQITIKGPFGYNWKLKLKTEKYCSKIIFKCVNSTVGPIFNEKVAEKWNLWIHKQYTMCTDWLKKVWKVQLYGYCSLNSAWIVAASLKNVWKKNGKMQTQTFQPNPNVA